MQQPTRRGAGVLAAFAVPCVPFAALGLPLAIYLPEYYANELGLGLGMVGAAFLWVRLIDVVFDPLIGALMDNTRTRFGRFKPWMAAGGLLLFVSGYFLFFARPGVSPLHLWIWLPVAYAAFSICVLSQTAWGSTLSDNYHERSRVYGYWQVANVIGVLLALLLAAVPPILLHLSTDAGRGVSVRAMGWFILVSTPLCVGLALWRAPEPPAPVARNRTTVRDYLALFANRAVSLTVLTDLMIGTALGIVATLFFFFVERLKGLNATGAGVLLLLYFVSGLVFAPLWTVLARRLQKHRAMALAALLMALGQAGLLLTPNGSLLWIGVVVALMGIPYSASSLLLRSMMADASDEIRLKTGANRTGLLYAVVACTTKLGSAIAVGVSFPLLDAVGFQATAGDAPSRGLTMLLALFVAVPILLCLVAVGLMLMYRLGPARHAEILAALEPRAADA
jgi:Na+/melibiose symporter-like transporter